ncbi:MAG: glycosyltransferase [Pyrobaculum sp.]|jgi:glycosyltransferase involved in cell wall biosynthesis
MRIAVVSASVPKTLSEIRYSFVYDEVTRLAKHGIEVHVVRNEVGSSGIFNGIYFYDLPTRIDLTVLTRLPKLAKYPLPSLIRGPRGFLSLYGELRYANQIRKILQNTRPDILHVHFAYPEGWTAYLAKTSSSHKPHLVVTLHGYDIQTEPTCNYGIRLYRQYDALVKKVLNNADAIIVSSTAIYMEAQKIVKNPDKVHLIYNGVDTTRFHPSLDGKKIKEQYDLHGKFVIFTARHHRCVYGLEYLIRSAPIVLKKRSDVVYIIGGDGPLRPHLINLAKTLGVEKHIIFTSSIPSDQLPHYYVASDVVVVPSLQEGWGLVVTEAMATGKPVIGTKVGGIPDQIIDGYNGFLVPPRDPEAIARKILELAENPEKTKEMGKKARQLAEEKFNIEIRTKMIITLYKELLH